jgi:cysteine synthase
MVAAMKGYRMILVMPDHLSVERRQAMRAYGAELILTPKAGGMEHARDFAERMRDEGKGIILDQFANPDNPLAHYRATGPEIWRDTRGTITHFVSAMGTTGTIMGVSRFLKEQNPAVRIVGAQPEEGSQIPGSASGRRLICPGSTTRRASTGSNRCRKLTRKRWRAASRRKKASSAAYPPAAPAPSHCASRAKSRTRRSCSWSAIAAIVICRRACSPAKVVFIPVAATP